MDLHEIKTTVWQASSQHGERNDCSVKAVAVATGCGYDEAHAKLKRQGRQRHHGTYKHQQLAAIKNLGCSWEAYDHLRQPNGSRYTPKTIGKFCHTGNWMVWVRGHVFAVIDGRVLDWTDGRKHRITQAYKIIGETEMNALTNEYNELATELGLPVLKARIRSTTKQTAEERVQELRDQLAAKKPAPQPTTAPVDGFKKVRIGTALHTLIELTIDNPGFTRDQLCALMEEHGFVWQSSSVAVNMSWQIPKKGYKVRKEGKGSEARYWITNAKQVV